ncbi:MAG: aspartate carbamoyltransferase [Candidatus Woesearchaeota archaeon]
MKFKNNSLVSICDISKNDIIEILDTAAKIEGKKIRPELKDRILATLFYEPSTRTRLSFTSAMERLKGRVLGFDEAGTSSAAKGETVADTIKMVESYADIIVMRHYIEGAARIASEVSSVPVINAGDGSNQHPTQTLLDLYSIKKTQGRITGLSIGFLGDLKYGRTVHSLVKALSLFGCRFFFISPKELAIPKQYLDDLDKKNIEYSVQESFQGILPKLDILYCTRIQKERFPDEAEYLKVKGVFVVEKAHLKNVKKNFKIFHPLPRVGEISTDVDDTPYAYYFQQAANGIPVRQAILCLLLGKIR